jgi:hypothetical protein
LDIQTRDGSYPTIYVKEDETGLVTMSEAETQELVQQQKEAAEEAALAEFTALFPEAADAAFTANEVASRTGHPRSSLLLKIKNPGRFPGPPGRPQVGPSAPRRPNWSHTWRRWPCYPRRTGRVLFTLTVEPDA